ncbi:MAG TPA: TIGR03618 family F420-dependent PPOX class oxidoreductase [Actinomycetota bacterium]|nr:TIGR03618 family F420-dependent PPOX class oxidoreductase [Actinomycetota bacterium]
MRHGLSIDELGDLITEPHVAVLATHRADGSILLSPVYQEWRDGGFNVIVSSDDVKARHLRRDPGASLALFDDKAPYRGLEIHTTAKLVSEGASEALRRLMTRFDGEQIAEADAAATEAEAPPLIIRLEPGPGELRSWDYADEF